MNAPTRQSKRPSTTRDLFQAGEEGVRALVQIKDVTRDTVHTPRRKIPKDASCLPCCKRSRVGGEEMPLLSKDCSDFLFYRLISRGFPRCWFASTGHPVFILLPTTKKNLIFDLCHNHGKINQLSGGKFPESVQIDYTKEIIPLRDKLTKTLQAAGKPAPSQDEDAPDNNLLQATDAPEYCLYNPSDIQL